MAGASPPLGAGRRGFTLVETLIALVLSSFVIMLVSHAFLVQNRFYATQTLRTGAQDNARAATEIISREIRGVVEDGVVVAGARTLVIRSPMVIGVVCSRPDAMTSDVMTEGGQSAIDTGEVGGLAIRGATSWDYQNTTWATVDGTDTGSPGACFGNGADTVGARDDFHRLGSLNTVFTTTPVEGDVVMVFRETTFTIRQSQLDSTTLALFRTPYGGAAVEFATGMDTTAQFQYRTGGTTYADTISTALGTIDVIRIVAEARKPAPTGGVDDITFGWSVNVPLRNIR